MKTFKDAENITALLGQEDDDISGEVLQKTGEINRRSPRKLRALNGKRLTDIQLKHGKRYLDYRSRHYLPVKENVARKRTGRREQAAGMFRLLFCVIAGAFVRWKRMSR